MNNLAFGPYIGDFKTEVFYFLPYINWVTELLKPDSIFIQTHFNRKFLYSHLTNNILENDHGLTFDESAQKKHFNKNIFKPEFSQLQIEFLYKLKNSYTTDFTHYNFEYNRYKVPCSIYQKKFTKLNHKFKYQYKDKIVFIPDINEKEDRLKKVYEFLQSKYDVVVIGDRKTRLQEENILMNDDYTKNVYKSCINIISSCKAVICPASYWTGICNLQQKKVFSWGNLISRFKEDEIYNFSNNGTYLPNLDINILIKQLDNFLERIDD